MFLTVIIWSFLLLCESKSLGYDKWNSSSDSFIHCDRLTITGSEPVFFELPSSTEGRIYVPIHVNMEGVALNRATSLKIFISNRPDVTGHSYYTISIGAWSGLSISKTLHESSSSSEILDTSVLPIFGPSRMESFFVKVKKRPEYTGISLHGYEASEIGEPLVSIKDSDQPLTDVSMYGFALVTQQEEDQVRVHHVCQASLFAPCVHALECVDDDTTCTFHPGGVSTARCECDETHILDENGLRCVDNPIQLGDPCVNSKQCAQLDAKCRTVKGTTERVCKCFPNQEVDEAGRCVEEKDKALLDFGRLTRKPTWQELNPGRVLINAVPPHPPPSQSCALIKKVRGENDYPRPNLPREFFPLPWSRVGFQMGIFLKGTGSVKIQFARGGEIDKDNVLKATLTLDGSGAVLLQTDSVRKVYHSRSDHFLPDGIKSIWITFHCPQRTMANCTLAYGRIEEGPQNLLETTLDTPNWPTHFAFVPGSRETDVSVATLCSGAYNSRCAHYSDCQRVDGNLTCIRSLLSNNMDARCRCDTGIWNEDANSCRI